MAQQPLKRIKLKKTAKELKKEKAKNEQATQHDKLDYIIMLLEEKGEVN